MSKVIKLYTLNMCTLLYVNYTTFPKKKKGKGFGLDKHGFKY